MESFFAILDSDSDKCSDIVDAILEIQKLSQESKLTFYREYAQWLLKRYQTTIVDKKIPVQSASISKYADHKLWPVGKEYFLGYSLRNMIQNEMVATVLEQDIKNLKTDASFVSWCRRLIFLVDSHFPNLVLQERHHDSFGVAQTYAAIRELQLWKVPSGILDFYLTRGNLLDVKNSFQPPAELWSHQYFFCPVPMELSKLQILRLWAANVFVVGFPFRCMEADEITHSPAEFLIHDEHHWLACHYPPRVISHALKEPLQEEDVKVGVFAEEQFEQVEQHLIECETIYGKVWRQLLQLWQDETTQIEWLFHLVHENMALPALKLRTIQEYDSELLASILQTLEVKSNECWNEKKWFLAKHLKTPQRAILPCYFAPLDLCSSSKFSVTVPERAIHGCFWNKKEARPKEDVAYVVSHFGNVVKPHTQPITFQIVVQSEKHLHCEPRLPRFDQFTWRCGYVGAAMIMYDDKKQSVELRWKTFDRETAIDLSKMTTKRVWLADFVLKCDLKRHGESECDSKEYNRLLREFAEPLACWPGERVVATMFPYQEHLMLKMLVPLNINLILKWSVAWIERLLSQGTEVENVAIKKSFGEVSLENICTFFREDTSELDEWLQNWSL